MKDFSSKFIFDFDLIRASKEGRRWRAGWSQLDAHAIEAQDFALQSAGQAAKPNRFAKTSIRSRNLDLAIELHEYIARARSMHPASRQVPRRHDQGREFGYVEYVKAAHKTGASRR